MTERERERVVDRRAAEDSREDSERERSIGERERENFYLLGLGQSSSKSRV